MLSGHRRAGFSLMEVMVVVAIGVILAVAIVPSLIGSLDRSRVHESAESLSGIAEAAGNMYDDVERYAGRLSHLTAPVAGADTDLCGTTYGGDATAWNGPYLNRTVPATGLVLPIGVARDSLGYSASPPIMTVFLDEVDEADAEDLDDLVDDDDDSTAGAVRWGAVSGTGVVVLSYVRPVKPC